MPGCVGDLISVSVTCEANGDRFSLDASLFGEFDIKGGQGGIHMMRTSEEKPSDEAYVKMESDENCKDAVKKDGPPQGGR